MDLGSALGAALVCGLFGLAILIVLWPGQRQGAHLLAKWGLPRATPEQVGVAVRYLRRRRFWYPWLFVGLPLIPGASRLADSSGLGTIVAVLLLGGLIAEVLAQRPTPGSRREAVLAPRGVLDFAPLWAIIATGLPAVAAAVHLAVLGEWVRFAVTLASAAVACGVVLLAVRRPATGDPDVDLALRCRSAHVALGLATATCAVTARPGATLPSFLAFVGTLAAFLAIASPPRKLPATAAAK
ncbi:hypothetical protein [Amycolatopsis sp. FDAARGOS 1241]|uniref:hypothetical protein n=1 Tax=Amycolatopsis sp. FDAARGOS 1241 TaxID=2778070 RepID=UPI0019519CC1|nr:hypothetical protein [Amycolatopsis sp. FDAARGOS 1241]QRP51127.1 hypothetical protein I6J71_35265 [Amycolatopsis sp. FDAARGOS 1241]